MSLVAFDDSSAVADSQKFAVTNRDGGLCVLCGMDPVDVVPIVASKSGDYCQIDWISRVAPSLSSFRKDDASNLICLCPTHHRQFVSGRFVLVPSKRQRELLLEHERGDFIRREEIMAVGGGDPGRTFPELIDEFEYIPVYTGPFRIHMHNPTPYDPYTFVFDTLDHRESPLLHFRASHIALMVGAKPRLSSVARLQSLKGEAAESQISTLLRLYQRQPGQHSNVMPAISVPDDFHAFRAPLEEPNTHPSAIAVPAWPQILNATSDGSPAGFPPSSSASSDGSSSSLNDDPDTDFHERADMHLMEYAREPSVTWKDLKNRPPLFGGEETGPWRFASAEDICRSRGL